MPKPGEFVIYDSPTKKPSFSGKVLATFTTSKGKEKAVVENTDGILFIHKANNLITVNHSEYVAHNKRF